MSNLDYTFAVARIRALESKLFDSSVIEQLLSCKTQEACLSMLAEKGWGDTVNGELTAEAVLSAETKKTWEIISQLNVDTSAFDVLSYVHLFHNLKAAIKEVCTEEKNPYILYDDAEIDGNQMMEIIRERQFVRLPENMRKAAEEAYDTLLHTRDGQLCDMIIDRATLEAIRDTGRESSEAVIRDYVETMVAVADIKVALRCSRVGKSLDFIQHALVSCDTINVGELARAAANGEEALKAFLSESLYKDAVPAIEESLSAFERWYDNRIIDSMRPQKYVTFSVGPLVAYVLARENEIKTVGIILSGKANQLPEESIRGRVREMYV